MSAPVSDEMLKDARTSASSAAVRVSMTRPRVPLIPEDFSGGAT